MTPSAVAEALLALESRVLDLDWRWRGVNVWPMYRCLLLVRLFEDLVSANEVGGASARLSGLLSFPPRARVPKTLSEGSGCTVLLNDGYSLQRVGDRIIDRFCTPLSLGLDDLGIRNVLLDQGMDATPGLAARTERVGPTVLRAKAAGLAISRVLSDPWVEARCARLREAAVETGVNPDAMPRARDMLARQVAMMMLSRAFGASLRRWDAERVFQVGYYSVAGHAMNLAARRLGIPVIDVQHGVISPLHLAYARWSLAAGQDALTPTGHWTWDDQEAEVVRQGRNLPEDAVVAAGHPFVFAWRTGRLPGIEDARAEARGLRAAHAASRHAAVTLQPGLMERDELATVLEAMHRAKDVFWWFRPHPVSRDEIPRLRSLFDETGADYDIDLANRLPLYAILENVDVNLTHSSTTVIEAAAFGTPSILWSPYGAEFFAEAVRSGEAFVALDADRLVALLEGLPKRSKDLDTTTVDRFTTALLKFGARTSA